ncbi:MAG: hypothetical protein U0704_08605 [Candidatus Eisenbacteria bacterium]
MTDRELLRHALAVLAYRGGKPLRGAPPEFAGFDTGGGHTPLVIVAHLGDLLEWTLSHARGEGRWPNHAPTTWDEECARYFAALAALDAFLASDEPVRQELTRLLQGPIADALTHVGQLMMLRRMSGSPVYGENYLVADIVTGRVGSEQSPPVKAF